MWSEEFVYIALLSARNSRAEDVGNFVRARDRRFVDWRFLVNPVDSSSVHFHLSSGRGGLWRGVCAVRRRRFGGLARRTTRRGILR